LNRSEPFEPTYFHLAPELRRSAVYFLVSLPLIAAVVVWVGVVVNRQPAVNVVPALVVPGLIGLALILALRWTVRIDDRGVARCFLFRWDVWAWDDFASGRIQKRYRYTFRDPARPWWRRRLRLDHLSGCDVKRAIEVINARYRLPDPPELPEALTVKYGLRRSVRLDRNGVHVLAGDEPREYLWNDVKRVRITRMDPLRRDFHQLVIELPHEEFTWRMVTHQGGTTATWSGATSEELNEFLHKFMPAERIDVDICGERPKRRVDTEKQLQEARKQYRACFTVFWGFVSLALVVLLCMALAGGLLKGVVMGVIFVIYAGLLFVFMRRDSRKRCIKLEGWLAAYETEDGNPSTAAWPES
jgi:hypothetical protein